MPPTIDEGTARDRIDEWLAAGVAANRIEERLRNLGMTSEQSARLIDEALADVIEADSTLRRSADRRDLLRGAAWCLAGLGFLAAGLATFHRPGGVSLGLVGTLFASTAALGRGGLLILRAMT